jgi:hypothetical protein
MGSIATTLILPSTVGLGQSSQLPLSPSASSDARNLGSSTNKGAIAGGVIGAFVGLAAIIAVVATFLKRRAGRRHVAPSAEFMYNSQARFTRLASPAPMFRRDDPMSYQPIAY